MQTIHYLLLLSNSTSVHTFHQDLTRLCWRMREGICYVQDDIKNAEEATWAVCNLGGLMTTVTKVPQHLSRQCRFDPQRYY